MAGENGSRDLRDAIGEAHAEKHDLEASSSERGRVAHAEKHAQEQTAVSTALDAERSRLIDHRTAHDAAHASHEKLHDAFSEAHKQQHAAESDAVMAATSAMDRRLDSMNEFRDQLRDQAATFIRREQLDSFIAQYERAHDEVVQAIRTEREERRSQEAAHALIHRGEEGVKRGMSASVAIIVGAITLAVTILGAIILVANFATGTPP